MKFTVDYFTYLHKIRKTEFNLIFSKCSEKLFKSALEVGAGDGFLSKLLTKYVSKLICTDINPLILQNINTKSIEYLTCDAENLVESFHENRFDLIFSSNLLEHISDTNLILESIHKLLKDDGITIHIMPNPVWKVLKLILHIPFNILKILETLTEPHGINKLSKKNLNESLSENIKKYDDNPKIKRQKKPKIYRFLIPEPHGTSSNNIKEIFAFSKLKWIRAFKKANFQIINVVRGPVASGYGFGFEKIRSFLEKIGLSTEFIYIAIKNRKNSPYSKYFFF